MSKIGRKPIDVGDVEIKIKGQEVDFKGKKGTGVHVLPEAIEAQLEGKVLKLTMKDAAGVRSDKGLWGLHRALLANKIRGAQSEFEKLIEINGLGFKAAASGKKVVFSLGFSHKIDFDLPNDVSLEIDKTGQRLTLKSADKEKLGYVCSRIKALRPPEPYKGTGIKLSTDVIRRKAGKTKAAAG